MKFLQANRIAPDGTPQNAASHLGLCCLPMSTPQNAASYLGLCCLPMSHKRAPGLNELILEDVIQKILTVT